jgi:hypothetical protein
MKFKMKDLKAAIDHMRYSCHVKDDSELEILLNEEDIQDSKLGSCMEIRAEHQVEASSYESTKTPKTVSVSIEVFPTSENRPMRSTIKETREIETS